VNAKKTKQVPATKKRTANKMKSYTTNQKTWQSTIAYVSLNKGGSLQKEGQSKSKKKIKNGVNQTKKSSLNILRLA
jgi:pullulanase/glycogen debranching enzyme